MKNCPFYGHMMFVSTVPQHVKPFLLMATDNNQCGLLTGRKEQCYMEMNQLPVEWGECPWVRDIRIGWTPVGGK